MKYGRTSIVHFFSQLLMAVSGFITTIILTRTLGKEKYGTYVIVLSVLAWAAIFSSLGIGAAIRKRVSEMNDGNHAVAGILMQAVLFAVGAVCLWIFQPVINDYMGIVATDLLIVMLVVRLALGIISAILEGQHLVHVASILTPIEWTSRSAVQITLVLAGYGVIAVLWGYIVGAVLAVIIGVYFATWRLDRPRFSDFRSLFSFARFSWLSSIRGQTFQSMDIIVLAYFFTSSLVAVYEIAWSVATILAFFGSSIQRTLFPEMSKIASQKDRERGVEGLLRVSLTYAGLFVVPGLVGSLLVGDVILTIYGPGFDDGHYILVILAFSQLLYSYMTQLLGTVDALDRPELSLWVNGAFVLTNLVLNVTLTAQFGWYGTATASALSTAVGLAFSYRYAGKLVEVVVPYVEILKQWASAGVMAIVVYGGRLLISDSLSIIILLVGVGTGVYFATLFGLSEQFRQTTIDNLPATVRGLI